MKINRKLNIIVALVLAIVMVMPVSPVYAEDNEAYVYQYTGYDSYSDSKVPYADGNGSATAALMYVKGPDGNLEPYAGYCVDLETSAINGKYYSRTTLTEAEHFSDSVSGHLRAILANSVPVVSLSSLESASGAAGLTYGEAVAATQWAIWSYTNSGTSDVAPPQANAETAKEKAAYYLYTLPPVTASYATEPVLINISAAQDGNKVIFDYSGSVNIGALYDEVITITDGDGNAVPFVKENNKAVVDTTGFYEDKTLNFRIEGKQTLAADAYFYNPEGGRSASQALVSWYSGVTEVAGTATGSYDVDKEKTELVLTGDKELTGRDIDPAVDKFSFVVTDANGATVTTGTSDASGKITFAPVEYTKSMKGSTFEYSVKEVAGDNPGIEYDAAVYNIKVTVGYENGKVTAEVDYGEAEGIEFVNKYTAKDGSIALNVFKDMEGKELQEGMFQFTKVKCDAEGVPLEGAETETVGNKADGTIVFGADTYDKEGAHYYLIKEVDGGERIDGITYDDMEMVVKVTVTDNKYGQLVAEAGYPEDKTFNNIYTADPDSVLIDGQKYLDGRPMEDGEFTFVVKDEEGEVISTAVNDADGHFGFEAIEFAASGIYRFTVSEAEGSAEGVTYDKTVHEVVVTVTDDGKGKLHAELAVPEGGIVFNNEYTGPGQITVTKTFRLNDAATASEMEFEVGLFTDESCTEKALYADGTEVENQIIRMNGEAESAVTFTGLEYGTYYAAEIGKDGTALAEGTVTGRLDQETYRQVVSYESREQILTPEAKEGTAGIVNDFYTEEYYLQGQIRITKQVMVNGEPEGMDAVYFFALFEDPELTVMTSDIEWLAMGNQSEASVVFEKLEINKTYYVAETDPMGTPISAGEYGIREIEIVNGVIEIVPAAEPVVHEAVITNHYDEEEFNLIDEGDPEEEVVEEVTETTVEDLDDKAKDKDKAVKTGDDFNTVTVLMMMIAALIVMAAALFRRKDAEER